MRMRSTVDIPPANKKKDSRERRRGAKPRPRGHGNNDHSQKSAPAVMLQTILCARATELAKAASAAPSHVAHRARRGPTVPKCHGNCSLHARITAGSHDLQPSESTARHGARRPRQDLLGEFLSPAAFCKVRVFCRTSDKLLGNGLVRRPRLLPRQGLSIPMSINSVGLPEPDPDLPPS